ncbi:MAG TPA: protein tonB [Thermomonas sp.]|jgi:hypothetical protein|nr:protein tonB [Thermomonas sp.]
MKRYVLGALLGLALLGAGNPADAGTARGNRKLVESSLLVKGTIVIAPDGAVQSYTLESKEGLGEGLEKFLDNAITHWRFKPVEVDGKVVTAKAPMSLRLIANQEEDGGISVRLAGTWFGSKASPPSDKQSGKDAPDTSIVRRNRLKPPMYPSGALQLGGQGIAYLVIGINRNGHVQEVDVEKVNLRSLGTDQQMDELRKQFGRAAVLAAKQWTFIPPSTGKEANENFWRVRVPVDFRLSGATQPKPGQWESYIPDPTIRVIPWVRNELMAAGSPDALPGDGIYPLQQSLQLLNPPGT